MIYNTARPMNFDEVKGQELIVENIRNQSICGKFFPVIILCGQYGSGKTTMARLIAMSANCTHKDERGNPCGVCESCRAVKEHTQDGIIEIDGASNNGVDAIRSLVEQMNMLSVYEKKVIVIDEAHMLSKAAWNALLITLENPPAHCIVIICTTEKDSLPATVVSRAPVYMFGKISDKVLKQQILDVASKNQIQIEPDAAGILARYADGAMRNGLQLLEYLALQRPGEIIKENDVVKTLGLSTMTQRGAFLKGCFDGDVQGIVEMLNMCYEQGINLRTFLKDVLQMNTDLLLAKAGVDVVGTECYLDELTGLTQRCAEQDIVRLNRILSKLSLIPDAQVSIGRIVVDIISVLNSEKERVAFVSASDASNLALKEEVKISSKGENNGPNEVISDSDKDKKDVIEERASEAESVAEKSSHESESEFGNVFSGFGIGGIGFSGFGGLPVMSSKKVNDDKVCARNAMVSETSSELDTLEETEFSEAGVECPFKESVTADVAQEDDLMAETVANATETSEEVPLKNNGKEQDIIQDSQPAERDKGQVPWEELARQGVVKDRDSLVLPVPPSREDVREEYHRQAEEREEAEEKACASIKTRVDLINARNELCKLLKNPGFEMLYKKARIEEVDFEIHLYFKNIVQLKAMQLMLLNSNGIVAEQEKDF